MHAPNLMKPADSSGPLKVRVLLADDEMEILEAYSTVLAGPQVDGQAGRTLDDAAADLFGTKKPKKPVAQMDLVLCSQGDKAVSAVAKACGENNPFAAAIVDVRMPPGIDGVTAACRIRALDPDIFIVFVTGYSDISPSDITEKVPPAGKVLYMTKPVTGKAIEKVVTDLNRKWSQTGAHS